jgi:predicted Zn-dependent protease
VLSHAQQRWEIEATQSATQVSELDAARLHADLSLLLEQYRAAAPVQVAPGTYDVVFGAGALAALLNMCAWIGFSGGNCKRQLTFLKESDLGRRVFNEQVSVCDDPRARATFPYAFDAHGTPRAPFALIERGVFKAFMWPRDDADEFGARETGHSVPAISLVMQAGTGRVRTLSDVLRLPLRKDTLFIPHLHYMNVVNETEGIVTCCSRFGALLLRANGSIAVPYNLRVTEKLVNIFGNIDWLSDTTTAVNTSNTYGTRNPTAVVLPAFGQVRDVNIPHTNSSF